MLSIFKEIFENNRDLRFSDLPDLAGPLLFALLVGSAFGILIGYVLRVS